MTESRKSLRACVNEEDPAIRNVLLAWGDEAPIYGD